MTQLSEYQTFVRSVEATATCPQRERLLHGALGLTCEYLEYAQAQTIGEKVKEMGDICYFLAVIVDALGGTLQQIPADVRPGDDIKAIESLASEVKRRAFYGKQRDADAWIVMTCNELISWMLNACDCVLDVNMMKLKARYPAGRFNASDAMARADEAMGETKIA